MMVEAGAAEISDDTLVEAIALAHAECRGLVQIQRQLAAAAGKPRWSFDPGAHQDPELEATVRASLAPRAAAFHSEVRQLCPPFIPGCWSIWGSRVP